MAKISPPDILSHISAAYPHLADPDFYLRSDHAVVVSTTLELLEKLDGRLLGSLPPSERSRYESALACLRATNDAWKRVSYRERIVGHEPILGRMAELGGKHPIEVVKHSLEQLAHLAPIGARPSAAVAVRPRTMNESVRWEVERSLSEGGQSHTFVVKDTTGAFAGPYVLKRLKNVGRKGRFEREIEVSLGLTHPHILKVVDSDLAAPRPYLVSEYHARGPLTQAFLSRLGVVARLRLFRQVAEALAEAHSKNIVHRDIKPENVLVRADGALVLADFGLCYIESKDRLTETFEVHANWLCTAPELEGGREEHVTPAADVYCLGKLLHWMLSGSLVPREQYLDSKYNLAEREPRPAHALVNGLLGKMILEDPTKRLKSGAEVVGEVVTLTKRIEMNAHEIDLAVAQHCSYCGVGTYEIECDPRWWPNIEQFRSQIRNALDRYGLTNAMIPGWLILKCNDCGNVQMFRPRDGRWLPRR